MFKDVLTWGCYQEALEEFGKQNKIIPYCDGKYNSKYMFNRLFSNEEMLSDFPLIKKLNELNGDFLYASFIKNLINISPADTIVLEMATLPTSKFAGLCKKIVKVESIVTVSDILSRDPSRDYTTSCNLLTYQKGCLVGDMITIHNDKETDDMLIQQFERTFK